MQGEEIGLAILMLLSGVGISTIFLTKAWVLVENDPSFFPAWLIGFLVVLMLPLVAWILVKKKTSEHLIRV